MIKRIIMSVLVLTFVLPNTVFCALPVNDNAKKIDINIKEVEMSTLKNLQFDKVDLTPYANRSYIDEVAGDMTGGWSDQGPDNDMRNFNLFGDVEVLGIPFNVIPGGSNGNRTVVAVRGKNNMELPNRVEIPYNKKAAGAYFLHSAPYAFSAGHFVGRYTFEYSDGTSAYTDLLSTYQISDFFGTTVPKYGKLAWLGDNKFANDNGYRINLSLLALKNPYPDKVIKNVIAETEGDSSFIMLVALTFVNEGPYYLQDGSIALNPDSNWLTAQERDMKKAQNSPIDVSYILDAPAGKYGFLKSEGDSFVFENGQKAKFWGTNLVGKANFPDKQKAEELSTLISQLGFNMVRMSELDGDFKDNIFEDGNNTSTLNKDSMDKLCYLIKCLKDKGIYTYLTVTSKRKAKDGDGIEEIEDVSDGYKVEGFFDDKLISLQKDYLKKLLTYKNPYTGLEIGKDPCVAIVEFMDSNSIFMHSENISGKYGISSDKYFNSLNEKFNEYMYQFAKNDSSLKIRWKGDYGYTPEKGISRKSLEVLGGWKNDPLYSDNHKIDIAMFMMGIHNEYYNQMNSVAKECGFKGVTTACSNAENEFEFGDIFSKEKTDFVAVNAYNSVNMGVGKGLDPVFLDADLGIMKELINSRIYNKPYMVSGYGTGFGAKFTADFNLAMAAISAQQGWSACQYYLSDGIDEKNNTFSLTKDFSQISLMPAAAILNKGLDELSNTHTVRLNKKVLIPSNFETTDFTSMLDKKVSVSLTKGVSDEYGTKDNKEKYRNKYFVFDSGKGVYSIRTYNTEACVGMLSEIEVFEHMEVDINSSACAIALSVLDNKKFNNADRYLLTCTPRSRNKGMIVDEWYNIAGGEETVMEPIFGKVILKLGDVDVYALDFSGQRVEKVECAKDNDGNTVLDLTYQGTVYYEIVKGDK